MKRPLCNLMLAVAGVLASTPHAEAHCQIPCGIYDDATRFTLMREHVATIRKSMTQIVLLGQAAKPDHNQISRWVINKEVHADKLADIITAYFMAQRVKPVSPEQKAAHATYVKQIALLHQMLVTTMKTKQTVDPAHCDSLHKLLTEFESSYLGH